MIPMSPARSDILYRLAGVASLGAAVLSSLAHKALLAIHDGHPATLSELFLAMASFLLASIGVMLVINGARLFRDPERADRARRRVLAARLADRALRQPRR